ncbi:MAG: translocation/assembly module TamB domain-containing protein [bacterium]|nr:translocation/assembly module TamB domain-containing protein [bacterium]
MQRIVAILCFPALVFSFSLKDFSKNFTEKKILSVLHEEIEGKEEISFSSMKYRFPNELTLHGFKMQKQGIDLSTENISVRWELKPGFPKKVTLTKPILSIKKKADSKQKSFSPQYKITVIDGVINLEGIGEARNIQGFVQKDRFEFKGEAFSGKLCLSGKRSDWKLSLGKANLKDIPYLTKEKSGQADISVNYKDNNWIAKIKVKNGAIEPVQALSGEFIAEKGGPVSGKDISFKSRDIAFAIKKASGNISKDSISGKTNGKVCYKKVSLPFTLDFLYQAGRLRIKKGRIQTVSICGEIFPEMNIKAIFDKQDLGIFYPELKGEFGQGTLSVSGSQENPVFSGEMLIRGERVVFTKQKEEYRLSVSGTTSFEAIAERKKEAILIEAKNLFYEKQMIAENVKGEITPKKEGIDFSLLLDDSINLKGEIDSKRNINSLVQIKDRAVRGSHLTAEGKLSFFENSFVLSGSGRLGNIPFEKLKTEFTLKKGINFKKIEAIVDKKTALHGSGNIDSSGINIEILAMFFDLSHISERLAGISADFQGRIVGDLANPTIFGQLSCLSPKFRADFALIKDKLTLRKARWENIFLDADYSLAEKTIDGEMRFEDEDLRRIISFFLLPQTIQGNLSGTTTIKGSLANPSLSGSLCLSSVSLFEAIEAGAGELEFNLDDKRFSTKGFQFRKDLGTVSLSEFIIDGNSGEIKLDGTISSFSILGQEISSNLSFSGSYTKECLNGEVHLSNTSLSGYKIGDISNLISYIPEKGWEFGTFSQKPAIFGEIGIREKDWLVNLRLLLPEEALTLSGSINPEENVGSLSIYLLSFYLQDIPFVTGSGKIQGELKIEGDLDDPEINGMVSLRAASLKVPVISEVLSDVVASLSIEDGKVRLSNFSANTGKTKILAYSKKFSLERQELLIRTEGDALHIEVPGLVTGEVRANISVKRDDGLPEGGGEILFYNTSVTWPEIKSKGKVPSYLENILLGIKLSAKHNVNYYNPWAKIALAEGSWIRLKKIDEVIEVSGSCWAKKGNIDYLGQEFTIKEASLEFREGLPYLFGEAETMINRTRLLLVHKGVMNIPIEFVLSAPDESYPRTQEELIGLLQEGEKGQAGIKGFVTTFFGRLVGKRITKEASSVLRTTLGMDIELRSPFVEKVLSEDSKGYAYAFSGTEIICGKYLTDRLYILYNCLIEEGEEERYKYRHKIGAEYLIGKRTYLKYLYTPETTKAMKEIEISVKRRFGF